MDNLNARLEALALANGISLPLEAAAALSEAQATIARQQVMLDRALESNGDMQAEVARLREGLSRINDKAIMNAGEFARYVRNECATLEAKNG